MSNIFGARALFSMDASCIFPQSVMAITPWIGGVIGIVLSRACAGCEAGPPLCSVAINDLLEAGSSPQLLQ